MYYLLLIDLIYFKIKYLKVLCIKYFINYYYTIFMHNMHIMIFITSLKYRINIKSHLMYYSIIVKSIICIMLIKYTKRQCT